MMFLKYELGKTWKELLKYHSNTYSKLLVKIINTLMKTSELQNEKNRTKNVQNTKLECSAQLPHSARICHLPVPLETSPTRRSVLHFLLQQSLK